MLTDKVRIKKYQQKTVENWAKALSIPETKFVEEAINFYSRYLEGKVTPTPIMVSTRALPQQQVSAEIQDPSDDDFVGGIDL